MAYERKSGTEQRIERRERNQMLFISKPLIFNPHISQLVPHPHGRIAKRIWDGYDDLPQPIRLPM